MMKKKIFALVLALVMVLALVPAMAQAGSEQEDVTISKTATAVEGMVNAWDIELTVNAAAKVNPTPGNDVILVLDNSNSMYEGSRMANASARPRPSSTSCCLRGTRPTASAWSCSTARCRAISR